MTFTAIRVGYPLSIVSLNKILNETYANVGLGVDYNGSKRFARMRHEDSTIVSGSALSAFTIGADDVGRFPYHRYWGCSPAAINDEFDQHFNLAAGTYDFIVLARTASNAGIVSWSVDDVSIGTTDLYHATGVQYSILTISNVTISTDGAHTLTGIVSSKNASSSAYNAYLYKYCFREP